MKHLFIVINAFSLMSGVIAMVRLIQLYTGSRSKLYSAQILFFSAYSYLMTAAIIFTYIFINISSSEFYELLFTFIIFLGMAALETTLPLYLFRLKEIEKLPLYFYFFTTGSFLTVILSCMLYLIPPRIHNMIMAGAFAIFGLSLTAALILYFKIKSEKPVKGISPSFYILFGVVLIGAVLEIYLINKKNISFYTSLSLPAAYFLTSIVMLRTPREKRLPTFSLDNSDISRFNLTAREQQITELLLQGLSNKEIAFKLEVSESTVKNHIYNVFQKLDIQKRTDLFSLFIK